MLKNYNKDGQKLPLFGIGPYTIFGMVISTIGLIYGYCIQERNLLTIWLMLLGCFLCFVFAELIYKTYK